MTTIGLDMAKFFGYKYLSNAFMNEHRYDSNKIRNDPDNIISRLKIIGKIKEGYQFDIHSFKLQPYSWWTSFERTFLHPTSRYDTISFIKSAVSDSEMLMIYKLSTHTESDIIFCQKLLDDLIECKRGIMNLCKHPNYKNDISFNAEMETLLDKVDNIVNECRKVCPELQVKYNTTNNTPISTPTVNSPRSRSMSFA